VRVIQQVGELVLILAKGCHRQLRSHAGIFQPRVRGDKANFIDADSLRAGQRSLQLQSQLCWFGFAGGKRPREPSNLFFRNGSKELYAGQACGAEQLRELLFSRRTFQRHSIQQKLRIRRSEQHPLVRPYGNGGAQLLPRNLELFDRPGMFVAVQAGKFQQNVQASYEGASGSCFWVYFHPTSRTP
jgi:hypothetical protein